MTTETTAMERTTKATAATTRQPLTVVITRTKMARYQATTTIKMLTTVTAALTTVEATTKTTAPAATICRAITVVSTTKWTRYQKATTITTIY